MNIFERTVARPLGRAHRSSLSLATRQLFGIELPNGASASVNEFADVRVPHLRSATGAALGDRGSAAWSAASGVLPAGFGIASALPR